MSRIERARGGVWRPDYSKSPLRPAKICSKFGFVRSLDLFEVWVCSKFGFVRSLGLCEVWVCEPWNDRGWLFLTQLAVVFHYLCGRSQAHLDIRSNCTWKRSQKASKNDRQPHHKRSLNGRFPFFFSVHLDYLFGGQSTVVIRSRNLTGDPLPNVISEDEMALDSRVAAGRIHFFSTIKWKYCRSCAAC